MKPAKLTEIVLETRQSTRFNSVRLGTLVKIDLETSEMWVDYNENPTGKPIKARLGTPWITADELTQFVDRIDSVKIEFMEGDPLKPIIRDLFYSLNEIKSPSGNSLEEKRLELEADEIVLKGKTRVIIESGNARTIYTAKGNEITEEAEKIERSANQSNIIRGSRVLIN